MTEEELKEVLNLITEKAAHIIIPQLKLVNGQLRGAMNDRAREMNYEMLLGFITEVYRKGLEDGVNYNQLEQIN